jgi:hypothetical protein
VGEDFQRAAGASPDQSFSSKLQVALGCEAWVVEEYKWKAGFKSLMK